MDGLLEVKVKAASVPLIMNRGMLTHLFLSVVYNHLPCYVQREVVATKQVATTHMFCSLISLSALFAVYIHELATNCSITQKDIYLGVSP